MSIKDRIDDVHKVKKADRSGEFVEVPLDLWEIMKAPYERPMKLVLDYTEATKAILEDLNKNSFKSEFAGQAPDETTLMLYYLHPKSQTKAGEHAMTAPEVTNARAARKRAKTLRDNNPHWLFEDKTK